MAEADNKPTVFPANDFDPAKDAEALNDAFRGYGISVFRVGTKDDVIISIFTGRSFTQRQKLRQVYKEKYNKDLVDELRSELSGDYLQIMEDMLDQPILLRAKRINKIINKKIKLPGSIGTDVALLEILYPLPKQELNSLLITYKDAFGNALIDDVERKVEGEFKSTVSYILQYGRSKQEPSPSKIQVDAQLLSSLTPAEWSPENTELMKIFLADTKYIYFMFNVLRANEEKSMLEVAKTETDEKYRDGFVSLVNSVNGLRSYHTDLLYETMKGVGTKDEKLIYLILTHCETDLGNIEDEFLEKYQESLHDFIKGDTTGGFQKVLLGLCGKPPPSANQEMVQNLKAEIKPESTGDQAVKSS